MRSRPLGLSRDRFVERLAYHYDQLNHLHPFREGNGRTQRIFWSRVAHDAGWHLDWLAVTGPENDAACRTAAEAGDLSALVALLGQVVVPVPGPRPG